MATVHDAAQAGISQAEAMQVVKCTTRFATVMCVIIAIVKIGVYLYTKAEVVRTSALDSIGDLVANMISLYTGYRMANPDSRRYPAGQGKFQSIGCLVFSTLMFTLMFGNALGNVESLMESKDDIGMKSITRFFCQTEELGGDFKDWHKDIDCSADEYEWKKKGDKIDNPLVPFFLQNGDDAEKEWAQDMDKHQDKITRKELAKLISDYENKAESWQELKEQNTVLALCATYKCCLWLFCVLYAIPKSGSSVLVALATDKRNDFVCTTTVIIATFFAATATDFVENFMSEDKVDPFVSFCLSIFIMYSWAGLMIEHLTILSQETANTQYCEGIMTEIQNLLQGSSCSVDSKDVKIYQSGAGNTIEATLVVSSASTQFSEVAKVREMVEKKLARLEDVERVLVFTAMPTATLHG